MKKKIFCDSSSLISLTGACSIQSLLFITKRFEVSFMISDSIEYESIIKPLNLQTKEYVFSALKIKNMLETHTLIKININPQIIKKRNEILEIANTLFFVQGRPINLLHFGEAEMLAIVSELDIKNILMDERTARLLIENPNAIKKHFQEEFKTHIMVNSENLNKLNNLVKGISVFRSTELISIAYSNGFFDEYKTLKKEVYNAILYKLKYSGCSIRYDEIEELIRTV